MQTRVPTAELLPPTKLKLHTAGDNRRLPGRSNSPSGNVAKRGKSQKKDDVKKEDTAVVQRVVLKRKKEDTALEKAAIKKRVMKKFDKDDNKAPELRPVKNQASIITPRGPKPTYLPDRQTKAPKF